MFKIRCILLLVVLSLQMQAQKSTKIRNHSVLKTSELTSVEDFFLKNANTLGINEATQMREIKRKTTKQTEHIKYQQYYNDIPVYGSIYMLHTKNNKERSITHSISLRDI